MIETTEGREGQVLRVADVIGDSIVDGPGLRLTVFTQGCPHRCPGCHNPATWDGAGGRLRTVEELAARLGENPLLRGLTLSGGEPFAQAAACAALARAAHGLGRDVWTYTGYTWEELTGAGREDWKALLEATDVLVDGPFLEERKSYSALFRGSDNQRLIRVRESLAAGQPVLWTLFDPLAHFQRPKS